MAGILAALLVLDVGVAVQVLLGHLIRRVRRHRGEIEEERPGRVLMLDELHRVRADQGGVVAVLLDELAVALPVDHPTALAGEVVHFAHDVAVEVVEAAVLRPILLVGVTEVPFADHGRLVADLLEGLRKVRSSVGNPKVWLGKITNVCSP